MSLHKFGMNQMEYVQNAVRKLHFLGEMISLPILKYTTLFGWRTMATIPLRMRSPCAQIAIANPISDNQQIKSAAGTFVETQHSFFGVPNRWASARLRGLQSILVFGGGEDKDGGWPPASPGAIRPTRYSAGCSRRGKVDAGAAKSIVPGGVGGVDDAA